MTPIRQILNQYPTIYAAAKALGVNRRQLKRLVDADAMYDAASGEVWIRSKTKIQTEQEK